MIFDQITPILSLLPLVLAIGVLIAVLKTLPRE
jgi:hypothetical protein